ncbi:MAG: signal peptidase I [Oscillospiraceae bacterium]
MSKLTKIYSIAVTAVTVAALVIAAAIVLPRIVGIECYAVKSGSMEPALHVGALAYINTKNTSPEVGEAAVYKIVQDESETLVMHRVAAKTDGGYRFKGDANKNADAAIVKPEQIVGTYVFQIPKAGFALAGLGKKGIAAVIIIVIMLNASVMIAERFVNKEKEEDPNEKEG